MPGWLRDLLPELLRLATALTGSADPAADPAADLVAEVVVRARSSLERIGADNVPETRLRRLVAQRFLAGGHRGPTGRGLDALPARQRTAVVLRDLEHLTGAEIATILDEPPARIAGDLRAAPTSYAEEITGLVASAPPPEAVTDRIGAARVRLRRRRTRISAVAVAAAAALLITVGLPTLIPPRLPADSRPRGEWRFSHTFDPGPGWTVEARGVLEAEEVTAFHSTDAGTRDCRVEVSVAGAYEVREDEVQRRFRRNGRPAVLGRSAEGEERYLAWEYGRDAWAVLTCGDAPSEKLLADLTARVRFGEDPVLLPFSLRSLPAEHAVRWVVEDFEKRTVSVFLPQPSAPAPAGVVIDAPIPADSYPAEVQVRIAERTWRRVTGSASLCSALTGGRDVCLTTSAPDPNGAAHPDDRAPDPEAVAVAELLVPAASSSDRTTWVDARTALPH